MEIIDWVKEGNGWLDKRDYLKAIECYDKAIELKEDYAEAYCSKGLVLKDLGKNEEAIKCFNEAIESKKNYAEAYNCKGYTLLYNLDKYEEAIEYFNKAIELKPDFTYAFNNKGVALSELDNCQDAIKYFDRAIELNKDYEWAYNNKGCALSDLGKHEKAIRCYDKAIELNKDFTEAYNNKGIALSDLGKYEEAIKYYDKAIELNKDFAKAYGNKGNALSNLGKYEEAIKYYDKAIELNKDFVKAYNGKGLALEKLGKYKEAVENFDHVLTIKPNHYEAATRRNTIILNMPSNQKEEYKNEKLKEFDKLLHYGFAVPFSNIDKNVAAEKLKEKILNTNILNNEDISNNLTNAYLRIEGAGKESESNYEIQIAKCTSEEFPILFVIYYYIIGKISPETASTLLLYSAGKMGLERIKKLAEILKAMNSKIDVMFACIKFLSFLLYTSKPSTTVKILTQPNPYDSFKADLPKTLEEERKRIGEDKFRAKYYFVEYLKEYKKLFE